jgi:hypothetical protein
MKPFCEIGQLAPSLLTFARPPGSHALVVHVILIHQCEQHTDIEQ